MKNILMLIIITSGIICGQTIHRVTPGIKNNKIDLTIANTSESMPIQEIQINVLEKPSAISFEEETQTIRLIKNGDSTNAVFTFDVARTVDANKTDTIKFVFTDNSGSSWEKKILIGYELPKEFRLEQNYPNPFNPSTTIEFDLPKTGRYNLSVFNILGQLVKVISEKEYESGYYKETFNAAGLSSGIYIYRLIGDEVNIVRKMMVIK
jgi:hypothetical protein